MYSSEVGIGSTLKCNTDVNKSKCYRVMNNILRKCGNEPELVIPLCTAYCFPVLMYGTEVMMLNNSQKISLDSTVGRLFYKVFNSNNSHVVNQCQFYMFCLPTSHAIGLSSAKLHSHLSNTYRPLFYLELLGLKRFF